MARSEGSITLTYGVRPQVVIKYLSELGLMLAALTVVPLAVSLFYGDTEVSVRYGVIVFALMAVTLPLNLWLPASDVQANEAMVITAAIFILAPLLMTYPMMANGLPFLDALFETISAATTTGLSTVVDVEQMSPSFLFGRAWMQWYGGLGIVVLSVALLMGHQIAARRLTERPRGEHLVTTTRQQALRMLAVYSMLTLAGLAVIALASSGDFLTVVSHTLSAVSTGGFSTNNASLAGFDTWSARIAITLVAFGGAIPLPLYYLAYRRGWRLLYSDKEVRALLLLAFCLSGVLALALYAEHDMPFTEAWANGLALGLSAQSTTGFSTVNVYQLQPVILMLIIIAMFIGGGLGSTAGGIKVMRMLIMVHLFRVVLRRTAMPPHAVATLRVGEQPIASGDLERALVLILLFVAVIVLSWIMFLAFGHDPMHALFEVASATGTVGLTTGITSADLHPVLKSVLCLDMLFGRLEIMAILVLLYPPTWFGKRMES